MFSIPKVILFFLAIAIVIGAITFSFVREPGVPVEEGQDIPKPLTEEEKENVLKLLETGASSADSVSDTEKKAVLDSLSGSASGTPSASSEEPSSPSDAEKEAILKALEGR